MKPLSTLCAIALALVASGCADPLEQRTTEEVKGQFQRGISGEGRFTPNEATNNPTGLPTASGAPPEYPPQ
jgi:hypothetical protein